LDQIDEEIGSLQMGREMSEYDPGSGNGEAPLDYYEDLGEATSRLLMSVANKEGLAPTRELVREFSMLSVKFGQGISSLEKSEIEQAHQDCVEEMKDLYSKYVWKYIASHMSKESAEGPKADRLAEFAQGNIDDIDAQAERQFEARRRFFRKHDLIPGVSDFPQRDDETDQALTGYLRSIEEAQ